MTAKWHWGKITPVKSEKVEELKGDIFPEVLEKFVTQVSRSLEISESVISFCILGILSTALQGKFVVKVNEDYQEPLNLYLMFSLPPAECKSAALKYCLEPLIKYEQSEISRLMEKYKREKVLYETKIRAIENSKKNLNIDSHKERFEQICELEANLTEPKSLPQYFLTDVTSEALVRSLKEQDNRIAIISDEGGALDVLGGLYNNGKSNIDILLKGWDGSAVRMKRMETSISLNPSIVFCLAVQPDYLDCIGQNRSFAGRGFFERFLYCVPEPRIGTKKFKNNVVQKQVKKGYEEYIYKFLSLSYPKQPEELVLTKKAECIWTDFRREIDADLRPTGKLNCCQRWGGKLGGQTLRLAGILHLVNRG